MKFKKPWVKAMAAVGLLAGGGLLAINVYMLFNGASWEVVFWGLVALGAAVLGAYELFLAKDDEGEDQTDA